MTPTEQIKQLAQDLKGARVATREAKETSIERRRKVATEKGKAAAEKLDTALKKVKSQTRRQTDSLGRDGRSSPCTDGQCWRSATLDRHHASSNSIWKAFKPSSRQNVLKLRSGTIAAREC